MNPPEALGHERLRHNAQRAADILTRVGGEGGVLRQIAAGEWDAKFTDEQAQDLADRIEVMAEMVRYTRAEAPATSRPLGGASQSGRLRLPTNRKERYYTGTVLPMIVASNGFAHLGRFLRLAGLDVNVTDNLDAVDKIDFLTEYSFSESVFTAADREVWGGPFEGDTPDVVIAGPDWLVAVEAKMFHNPGASDLNAQMSRQRQIIEVWADRIGLDPTRVRHILLLPEPLARRVGAGLTDPVVTWEQVRDRYASVAPRHWLHVLEQALDKHPQLESVAQRNHHDTLTGEQIAMRHAAGTLDGLDHVGRAGGGRKGKPFADDLIDGKWRETRYQVRRGALPDNSNWFTIADFVAATAEAETAPE